MKRTILGIFLLIWQCPGFQCHAEDNSIHKLIARINVVYDGGIIREAYGLVYCSREGMLSIITTSNIFTYQKKHFNEIRVYLDQNSSSINARLFYLNQERNSAAIQIDVPEDFVWPEGIRSREIKGKEIAYIYGRYGDVYEYSERTAAYVSSFDAYTFELESSSITKGSVGLPVVHNDDIIGLTTVDNGSRIIGNPLRNYHYMLSGKLGFNIYNYFIGAPNLLFGINLGLPLNLASTYPIVNYSSIITGFYLETGISPRVSVRVDYDGKYSLVSKNLLRYNQYSQVKTEVSGFSFFLNIKEKMPIGQRTISYICVGYSRKKQDFFVSLDNNTWQSFLTLQALEETPPEYCSLIMFKGKIRSVLLNRIVFDADIGLSFSNKNHLIIDPLSYEMGVNRISMNVGVSLGYLLINRNHFREYIF